MKSASSAPGRVLPVVTFHNETRLRILAASLLVLAMVVTGAALAQTSSNTNTSLVVETGSDADSSDTDVGDDQAERSAGDRLADGTDGAPSACTAVQPPAYAVKVANGWACVSG